MLTSILFQAPKRRRIAVNNDSEDDFVPDEDTVINQIMEEDDEDMDNFIVPDDLSDSDTEPVRKNRSTKHKPSKTSPAKRHDSYSPTKTPTTTRTSQPGSSLSKFSSSSAYTPSKDSTVFNTPAQSRKSGSTATTPAKPSFEKMNEERYQWLVEIKDADGNPEGSPDYDPRTLYIPPSAWKKFTPFEKQYWEVKSKMWNTVVFFKKGKFYELYENDADIAHSQFDLKLAGGGRANMRLAGVPEMSFDLWASKFIALGYKVARVDQLETSLGKEMRESAVTNKAGKKEEKIIRRELAFVLTGGTLVDEAMLVDDMSTYCMSIKQDETRFAICFVDTATSKFWVTEFEDDVDYTQFETLIAQTRPHEVILEKGVISMRAVKILKNNTSIGTIWNYLIPENEFWGADMTYEQLVRAKYFEAADLDDLSHYPELLRDLCQTAIGNPQKPRIEAVNDKDQERGSRLLLSAFGALAWYLRSLKIDTSVISLGNIQSYRAMEQHSSMVVDGQTLQNLEVFANTYDGSARGTLFALLNRCITPFGKRLLQNWVCHPLMQKNQIEARLDAIEVLMGNAEMRDMLENKMAGLPDLERLLSRVHAGRLPPKDFVRVIDGFKGIDTLKAIIVSSFGDVIEEDQSLIASLFKSMPPIEKYLPEWTNAIDWVEAKNNNILVPLPGVEPEYDEAMDVIKEIENRLNEKIREYRKIYKSQEICYRDSGKEIYLIEVPNKIKNIPHDWDKMGSTAKFKRYWSPEVRKMVRELLEAREISRAKTEVAQTKLYQKFDSNYQQWLGAVKTIASLDCLLSLTKTSMSLGMPNCRPELVDDEESGGRNFIEFEELRHPCFDETRTTFIPNDISLGGQNESNLVLLTGANAAGKSTVLRMTCVAVMMSQIGCFIPCAKARLTPVDRIMTRLGANDNIFAGKSTFYVELSETKRMLSEATPRTLLVLDELGRGGSSSDGYAIAEAVLHHLATHVGSLGFFATHYNTLYNAFKSHPDVSAKQMAIIVDEASRKVSFLYKLVDGVSPGSFGMHVASMCGISSEIVDAAERAAKEYEHTSRMKRLLELTLGDTKDHQNEEEKGLTLGVESDLKLLLALVKSDETDQDKIEHGDEMQLKRLGIEAEERRRIHSFNTSIKNVVNWGK